jgi:quaternary ammonium compound-resistance protein SugE
MNPSLLAGITGLRETGVALGLTCSDGFSKPLPSILPVVGAVVSL